MIKYLIMDVDGTLTDGKIYVGRNGELMKAFSVKDGCAIHDILPRYGVTPVILTARKSDIVAFRCQELNISEVYQGCRDKKFMITELASKFGSKYENGAYNEFAYIGDDIIDVESMKICRIKGCPSDAADEVKQIADYVCLRKGGDGAVREFVEWLCSTQF